MSFFGNVISGIDELGKGTFDNYGKMEIDLNQDACFFLHNLDNFSGLLTQKNNFTRKFLDFPSVQLVYTATIGLYLEKTNKNSRLKNFIWAYWT